MDGVAHLSIGRVYGWKHGNKALIVVTLLINSENSFFFFCSMLNNFGFISFLLINVIVTILIPKMTRRLKASHPLNVNMILSTNISNFWSEKIYTLWHLM